MNAEARSIVIIKYSIPKLRLREMIAWWHTVTVAPEERRISVFKRGISLGFNLSIPEGGSIEPSSILGEREEWKKAQKNEIKRNNSEIMKRITPILIPFLTIWVWRPRKLPSLTTSLAQMRKVERVKINPIDKTKSPKK